MSNSFHLAIPAGDLEKAEAFYTNILGCKTGNREVGKWVDIDFWGNELTLHQTSMKLPRERHDVDMGQVPVPHFGVHLKKDIFNKIKANIEANKISYIDWIESIPISETRYYVKKVLANLRIYQKKYNLELYEANFGKKIAMSY